MSFITLPDTFVTNTAADPSQVNADFNAIANVVNGQLDDSNIASNANINPNKISGTALTNGAFNTLALANIAWNPFFIGTVGTPPVISSWNVGANSSLTLNDTSVVSGVNSLTDANAADTWVAWQAIGTSLNNSATSNADILLVPGNTYVVAADVKTSSGGNSVFIAVQNASSYASGNTNLGTPTYHSGDGAYHKIYTVFTVPSGSNNITIALIKAATATAVTVCSFSLQRGSIPTPVLSNPHVLPSGKVGFDSNTTLTGSQLSATAGILGSQLVTNPSFNGSPVLASGYQATFSANVRAYSSQTSVHYGSNSNYGIKLTNIPSSFTITLLTSANLNTTYNTFLVEADDLYGCLVDIISNSANADTFGTGHIVTVGN